MSKIRYRFQVAGRRLSPSAHRNRFTLVEDGWDDFHFKTLFSLFFTDDSGMVTELGAVKIGQTELGERGGAPLLPSDFRQLDNSFFSVGQDREYYQSVSKLSQQLEFDILGHLNDIAQSAPAHEIAVREAVTYTSLLRDIDESVVLTQFRRISQGGVALTRYHMAYTLARTPLAASDLHFEVRPHSMPPTNIHVLIGSNGSGKTTLLRQMREDLLSTNGTTGRFINRIPHESGVPFSQLVTVAWSAFDPFDAHAKPKHTTAMRHRHVGLQSELVTNGLKSSEDLNAEFLEALNACSRGPRRARWSTIMEILCNDPLLEESGIAGLLDASEGEADSISARSVFGALSSGHKIVTLTMTRLVQLVEEQTLVLMDEPEAHLHPPLASAFTRALSHLLEDRNGVAIIATHSPVLLQEVPAECVHLISRVGDLIKAERLDLETFGEGVGVLTSAAFGLEVTTTGYHALLVEVLTQAENSYDRALSTLQGQVGGEGRAILRGRAQSATP